ncbi:hypothetical protein [Microbacterium halophytorum]|uniref:hypothetical protein n=1 Tax=Microbacterium halophytorum TaxID=2067568 RepID=UPI000CFCE8E7|nr:hypothetical protein [Microbacterium halophytorum]
MDVTQWVVALIGGGVVSLVIKTAVEQWNRARDTKVALRRQEIDRADRAERDNRILREALAVHRRIIIDAPCLGPGDLPDWPSTSAHHTKEKP